VEVLALPEGDSGGKEVENSRVMNGEQGRLVLVGVSGDLVTAVTSAAVEGFLTFVYEH